jgi:hypothetical protein
LALSRDQQLDLPDPCLPRPRAIPIAMIRGPLGADLAQLSTNIVEQRSPPLQLACDERDRLTREMGVSDELCRH